MKKRHYIYTILISLLAFSSCTDLDPEVYSDVRSKDYFQTPAQFSTLIANAYSQLAGEWGYVYREGYWSMQEYTSDEVVVPVRGTDWFDGGVPMKMHQHTWEDNTRDINNGWSFAFGGVTKCNTVLKNIYSIMGKDPSKYNQATIAGIAEAKVLRAFYHLLAMDLYANIHIDDNERPVKQYTRKEVYEWIEKEILDNIDNLDKSVRYGSVTKPVAHTILAKLYLNAEVYTGTPQWQKALEQCNEVLNGNYGYALNEDYFTTFKTNNVGDKEIIFPVVFDAIYAKGNMFHLMTLHYTQQDAYGLKTPTWNGPCTLESFYNSYDKRDKRKAQWFVGEIKKDGKVLKYSNSTLKDVDAIIVPQVTVIQDPTAANTFEGARFMKFELEENIAHHANNDFPIYRLADIYLMKAEALMRINGGKATAEALDAANAVRKRTGLEDYTLTTLTMDELLAERGRELAWEGHRRQDLIRFGKFTTGNWEFMSARSKNRNIFPIPTWVLESNPGVYTQNEWQ